MANRRDLQVRLRKMDFQMNVEYYELQKTKLENNELRKKMARKEKEFHDKLNAVRTTKDSSQLDNYQEEYKGVRDYARQHTNPVESSKQLQIDPGKTIKINLDDLGVVNYAQLAKEKLNSLV